MVWRAERQGPKVRAGAAGAARWELGTPGNAFAAWDGSLEGRLKTSSGFNLLAHTLLRVRIRLI